MKLCKVIRRDMDIELSTLWLRVILVALLFSFLFLSFAFEVFHYFPLELGSPKNVNDIGISLGDLLLVEIGGIIPKFNALQKQIIQFPTAFFLVHLLPCCFTLNYLYDDMGQGGIQIFIRLGDINLWWFSKCIRNLITVLLYYLIGFSCWLLLCVFTGKSLSLIPNEAVFEAFFGAYFTNATLALNDFFLCMFILPVLVVIALSLFGMTLTLFIKPIYAFFAICLYFISGLYVIHPVCLSNYAMPVRNATIGVYNFNSLFGIGVCFSVCVATVFVGKLRLRCFDIIGER